MAIAPVSSSTGSAQNAFGLDFQSLLQIILTQLTYQDPLKPVDNFQFVSQLAQFSQLQQSQTLNDQITSLLSAQAATQATGLLGKTVDLSSDTGNVSGKVTAVSFSSGQPRLTLQVADGQTISGVTLGAVTQIR
ncbi:flagellar hook assembly protein FlgD [Flavisphingomonas formosensis]|uniref:flagellar hook assembly protein FlgD n=1 Tax=Flavisphingomonas formosensis TaxID=861534 RepID=UPI0012FC31BA|nr:flagellar hook capping FlgD N-terminal domain-containing protein [Sphingomonas formosensis]